MKKVGLSGQNRGVSRLMGGVHGSCKFHSKTDHVYKCLSGFLPGN